MSALRRFSLPAACLAGGLLIGAAGTELLRPAPLAAATVDRTEKFVLFTAELATGSVGEGIFVLDTVNGKLYGGQLGSNGQFVASYGRDIAQDFGQREANAEYAVAAGRGESGSGFVYVAENRSGQVVAYAIPNQRGRAITLQPVGNFQFRQAIQ